MVKQHKQHIPINLKDLSDDIKKYNEYILDFYYRDMYREKLYFIRAKTFEEMYGYRVVINLNQTDCAYIDKILNDVYNE